MSRENRAIYLKCPLPLLILFFPDQNCFFPICPNTTSTLLFVGKSLNLSLVQNYNSLTIVPPFRAENKVSESALKLFQQPCPPAPPHHHNKNKYMGKRWPKREYFLDSRKQWGSFVAISSIILGVKTFQTHRSCITKKSKEPRDHQIVTKLLYELTKQKKKISAQVFTPR